MIGDQRQGPLPKIVVRTEEFAENDPRFRNRRSWVGAHVRSNVPWPTKRYIVEFLDNEIFLVPGDANMLPAAFMHLSGLNSAEAKRLLSRFLTAWCWMEQSGIQVVSWGEGSHPFRHLGADGMRMVRDELELDYLPENCSPEAKLAMALYREGMALDHTPYSFLSFFKVLNVVATGNSSQKKWIRDHLKRITEQRALDRLNELGPNPENQTVHDYLYNAGRSAVAHASISRGMTVDPDDPEDAIRLNKDLPLIQELARLAINHTLAVPSSEDIYRSNTFKIQGAIWMIGKEMYEKIMNGEILDRRNALNNVFVDIRVRNKEQKRLLVRMKLVVDQIGERNFSLRAISASRRVELYLAINFQTGRLEYDPLEGSRYDDDGSADGIEEFIELFNFRSEVFRNGRCQLVESDTGYVMAEADAYLPCNMMFDSKKADAYRTKLLAEADRRRRERREE